MLMNIAITSFLMVLTTVIHTGGMLLAIHVTQMKYQSSAPYTIRVAETSVLQPFFYVAFM